MTTRPTDEEIRAMADMVGNCMFDSAHDEHQWKMQIKCASLLSAWLAERQAARGGVTDEMVEKFVELVCKHSNEEIDYVDVMTPRIRDAIQSIAQPITSVSDALSFLEEWALSGNTLHGDDIQRFHATVERIAPVEQSARVSDEKSEVWVVQDETGCPIYCASYAQACHEHINDAINEHGIEEACAWKVIHYENSTSPQPQQAVPDGWKLVPEKFGIDRETWECLQYAFGGPESGENEPYLDCTAWIGELDEDDGTKSYGIHLFCDECPEEGSIPMAKFSAAPAYNGKKEG